MSHSAEKCKRGDPLGFINIYSVGKYQKTRKGDSFETLKNFRKKSHNAEKCNVKQVTHILEHFSKGDFSKTPWRLLLLELRGDVPAHSKSGHVPQACKNVPKGFPRLYILPRSENRVLAEVHFISENNV